MSIVSATGRSSCGCRGSCDMCPEIWSKLPKDMVVELLRGLPEQVLLRFRCVSKDLNFLITKLFLPKLAACARVAGFVFQWQRALYPTRYYRFSSRRWGQQKPDPPPKDYYGYVVETGLRYYRDGGELVKSYLSLLPFQPDTDDFLGCFNGFFLVRNSSIFPIPYYVCNPATKQCLEVPVNPQHVQKNSFVGLAFDPLDPMPHNFKILRIDCSPLETTLSYLNHQNQELDLFSSATGKWVTHQIPLESKFLEFRWNMRSIYSDRVFYMLSMRKYLLCFDLDRSEDNALKARAIELPVEWKGDYVGLFDKSNGCLYYACKVNDDLLVWTFQISNDGSPWTLKYNLSVLDLDGHRLGEHIRKQKGVFAVDLSAEIIYVGGVYVVLAYDIKNNEIDFYGYLNDGFILYAIKSCFYPYSCCLVRLSDQQLPG